HNLHSAATIRKAKREHESPATVVAEDQAGTTDAADTEDANDANENDQGDANENDQGDANPADDDATEGDQSDSSDD
ncbi:MAG: hypothetical protein QOJ29_4894, partial [Thermoleophilaceae bacterium]|nr:hypothetical protein [Thermoleophilaceae bacterium]